MASTIRHAPVAWAQRENLVFLTIQLDAPKIEELEITASSFKFKGTTAEDTYETSFDFFEEVNPDDVKKSGPSSRFLEFAITKKNTAWWPRLLKEKTKAHWLKVDFNKWKDEDEEVEGAGDPGLGGMGGMDNFDLSQYMGGMGGGGAPPDFDGLDDGEDDDMPDLEDDEDNEEEKKGEEKENGQKKE